MGRETGCPANVKHWQIDILSPASTREAPAWIRVRGLESMRLTLESETAEGAAATALWSEPWVRRRSGTLTLEGRPLVDALTGVADKGQAILDLAGALGGCQADTALMLADPFGRAAVLDVVVTKAESSADENGEKRTWELALVGPMEPVPYRQVVGLSLSPAECALGVGETAKMTVSFQPDDASNRKYAVWSEDPGSVQVRAVEDLTFSVAGLRETDGPVTVSVRSMNGGAVATAIVRVSAS